MTARDLLPCPFCGSRVVKEDFVPGSGANVRFIWCANCSAHGPWSKLTVNASELWNRRAFLAEPDAAPQGNTAGVLAAADAPAVAAPASPEEREGVMEKYANYIEKLAFKMPAPNPYTPQFVQLSIEMKDAARALSGKTEGKG